MRNTRTLGRMFGSAFYVKHIRRFSLVKKENIDNSTTTLFDNKIKISIDGREVSVTAGSVIIQACESLGIEIPRFCYHEKLAIAGNCRMCLVEVEKIPKPVVSCAMPVTANMKIFTNTPMVKKAREGVMEFLLANHPLDCPICDQGGECDLQDQAMSYGSDRSRFSELKRSVEDKEFGPLVKTSMNRCIHCTRCVRFMNDIAGVDDLGSTGRGNDMQISTYIQKGLDSELSGNIIDLCPVGALTSKPYAFMFRPWELKKTPSVDAMDGVGASIRVDSLGLNVMRLLPRRNDLINEEWLADKTRFIADGLRNQRLANAMLRDQNGVLKCIAWDTALSILSQVIRATEPESIFAFSGHFADLESLVALKDYLNKLNCWNTFVDGAFWDDTFTFNTDLRSNYIFNGGFINIEKADAIVILGSNTKIDAPLINLKIRKNWLASDFLKIGLVGPPIPNLTFDYEHLGENICAKTLQKANELIENAHYPMLIIGDSLLRAPKNSRLFELLESNLFKSNPNLQRPDWCGICFLHRNSSTVGALDVGWQFRKTSLNLKEQAKVVYLLNADDFDEELIGEDTFVIYQGHHGDRGASFADMILPGAAFTEKSSLFVNSEGRSHLTQKAVPTVGDARDDWEILRALAELSGVTLPYDTKREIYSRLQDICPDLVVSLGSLPTCSLAIPEAPHNDTVSNSDFEHSFEVQYANDDYYLTDCISRASPTMAKCSAEFAAKRNK